MAVVPEARPAVPSPSLAAMIDFQHVSKFYGTVIGLNDVHLALPPGGYGLIGPNGAGKTTFLHLLVGVIRPSLGTVHVFGHAPFRNPAVMPALGYCPATDAMTRSLSGWQWVRYLLELGGMPSRDAAFRATEVLTDVGMEDAMHRAMTGYSRGMRQRVKLAQSFAHDPQLLILDEPFNGLDPVARYDMTSWLRRWLQRGRSLILASHVLHEVESVVDSFLLVCGGRLLASGSSREVDELLADLPSDLHFYCRQRDRLAMLLLDERLAESVARGPNEGELVVSTRTIQPLLKRLPDWNQRERLEIERVESSDDSLQTVFDKLFRMHRGEL